MTVLAELRLAVDADAWREAGFSVDGDGEAEVGAVRLRLEPPGDRPGLRAWVLVAAPDEAVRDVDGIATDHVSDAAAAAPARAIASMHPNGALAIDHIVLLTPDLTRTIAAVEGELDLPVRRIRDSENRGVPVRQAFFRMGEAILEVVGGAEPDPRGGPARFFGIAFTVADLDAAARLLGDRLGPATPAVQPGRRIATVRKEAGLSVPVALMSRSS